MNNKNLEKQIIELIPSLTMKNAIKKSNHKFTDLEYVQLVEQFAKTWHSKLNLLNEIKENVNNKYIISYIEAYVKSEHNTYDKFIEKEENYVYDLIMDCISNHDEERYLCTSFNSIMKVIDSYRENFKEVINDDDFKHIKIIKRKISTWDTPEEIDENGNIDVYLNENMEIHSIYDDDYIDPEDYNLNMNAIKYPTIFKAGDLVFIDKNKHEMQVGNYTDYYYSISKDKIFGIVGINQNEVYEDDDIDVCYFLNLSNQYVYFKSIGLNELQYVNYLDCHNHIDFGYIEKIDKSEVHQKIKDDYEYAKTKLIELEIIK